MSDDIRDNGLSKDEELQEATENAEGQYLTTNQGLRVAYNDDSLKAGERGPTLLEDFHFREKVTHFDHERIPERVVHARGAGAHGYFQVYESLSEYTKAGFLQDPHSKTPVFVRFSTVNGSRGSADTVRDARGFATKFYTSEGVFDLVGNNIPVFFIHDAIKFPDLVHAFKPEPDNEMPQAATAHDTAWDFFSLAPENAHMVMWVLSDRAIPRSFRMMEGFGVNTFRFVNAQGISCFIKWHWKPLLGTHSLVWDEAQKLSGKDPDWLRRDLWEAIEQGNFPEYELGVQMLQEKDEFAFAFDPLDATKFWPEELVPVRRIGKMTLNRNPENFFAETEQVAFHPGHVIPGVDFSNDPLLQGRLFSYLDTQLLRLGGPNFAEIPINRPLAATHNDQRDGFMRQTINTGRASYNPNSLHAGCPMLAPENKHAYVHYAEKIDARKVTARSERFRDYYSQATLFWKSLSKAEQDHLVAAAEFELGKVTVVEIRERMVAHFEQIDHSLAMRVAQGIGVKIPRKGAENGYVFPQDRRRVERSPAISMDNTVKNTIKSRRIAVLIADGVNEADVEAVKRGLLERATQVKTVAQRLGTITGGNKRQIAVDLSFATTGSIFFDAVLVPGGEASITQLLKQGDALHFIAEAYKHGKPIGAIGEGSILVQRSIPVQVHNENGSRGTGSVKNIHGIVTVENSLKLNAFVEQFTQAIAQHRHWGRPLTEAVPA